MEDNWGEQVRELVAQGQVREAEEMVDQAGRGRMNEMWKGVLGWVCKGRVGGGWEAGVF